MIALFWRNRSNVAPANGAVLSHTASEAKGLVIAAAEEEKDLVIAEDEDAVLQLRVSPGASV